MPAPALTHPYFIANDPDAETTAVLLTGTADEFGIDQHDIQATQGGFNVTKAIAEAVYGPGFDDPEADDEGVIGDEDDAADVLTGQVPIVTGSPKDGSATTAVPLPADPDPEPEPETVDYNTWEYPDLKTAVATRGLDTENKTRETLIAALVADDAAQAESAL